MSAENNEEITLNERDSVEEVLAQAKQEREKALLKSKKRKKILIIAAIILAAVILLIVLVSVLISKLTPPMVTAVNPVMGDINATISVSGKIESEKSVQYYVPASVCVESIVSAGEAVSKGDILVKFEEQDYERVLREFELEDLIANNSYQSQLTNYEQNKSDLAKANANIAKYTKLRNQQKETVNTLTASITDANAIRAAEIEVEIYECQKKVNDYSYCIQNAAMLGMQKEGIDTYTKYMHSESQRIADLQFELSQLTGSVTAIQQQKTLTEAQKLLSDYETELTKAETEQQTLQGVVGNVYDEENLKLNGELSTMRSGKAYEDILQYKGGLRSEVSGVVIVSGATSGELTVPNSVLISVASTEKVKVSFDINKNDLRKLQIGQKATITVFDSEYEGTVSKIKHVAGNTTNGTASLSAEVTVDNPDSNIYLGMDAKVVIYTASKEDVLMLPVQVVNADKSGDFVYEVENGIVVKKYIEVGISTDEYIEVVSGIEEGADIVSTITSEVVEGARMVPIPDMMLQMQLEPVFPEETGTDEETSKEEESSDGVTQDAALPKSEEDDN